MKELKTINALVEHLKRLPSVGTKSAERMAYALLEMDENVLDDFGNILKKLKQEIHKCPICGLFTEDSLCEICADPARTDEELIVVSFEKDVIAFEKLQSFNGRYHVLGGVLSAVKGVGYDELNIDSLIKRISLGNTKEVIIATNPTIEGETTALFIAKLLEEYPTKTTRLAYGLPMGGHLDYADSLTLSKALDGRTKIIKE